MAFTYDLQAMLHKFGVVTVMDVHVYEAKRFTTVSGDYDIGDWDAVSTFSGNEKCFLNTLKIANITQEGPRKTATGGMNADILLKYGKTMRLECNDALGRYDVMAAFYGADLSSNNQILTMTDGFAGEMTLVGDTFVIDQATGAKQWVKLIIPIFLCDSIFNLTQDAEGDVSTFDLNGDILKFYSDETGPVLATSYGNIMGKGADNAFFFYCTKEIFPTLGSAGYLSALVSASV